MTFKVGDRVRIDNVEGLSSPGLKSKEATVFGWIGSNYVDIRVDGEQYARHISPHRLSLIPRDFVAELQALVNDARAAGYTVEAKTTETKETVL